MLRGTYETVKPVLDGYFYFKGKIDGIAKFLQADLPDTEATRQAVTEYLCDLEKYSQDITAFIARVRKNMGENIMPKVSDMITDNLPKKPESVRLDELRGYQETFVKSTMLFGLFAGMPSRYAIENNTSIKDINSPIVRSATADVLTIAGFSLSTGFLGKLFIDQNFQDGAKLGFKVSLMIIGIYKTARLGKYFADQTGISSIFSPKPK